LQAGRAATRRPVQAGCAVREPHGKAGSVLRSNSRAMVDGLRPRALASRESYRFTGWPSRSERKAEVNQWLTDLDGQA
jgi:hypothetical protein